MILGDTMIPSDTMILLFKNAKHWNYQPQISKLTIFGTNYTSDSNSLVICNSSTASHHQMKLRIFKAHWSQLRKTYVSWYLHLCSSKINFQGKATWYGTIQTRHILINIRILSYELNALFSTERGCVSCLKHILVVCQFKLMTWLWLARRLLQG